MYGRVAVSRIGGAGDGDSGRGGGADGEDTYVFLARRGGRFEPRRVTLGARDGEWVQVHSGLAVGDTVVASASFLIDSESRLKAAIGGMSGTGTSGGPPAGRR